jgi:hypothetical protein
VATATQNLGLAQEIPFKLRPKGTSAADRDQPSPFQVNIYCPFSAAAQKLVVGQDTDFKPER